MKYTKKKALNLIKYLSEYRIKVKLHGTLPSDHDIDLILMNFPIVPDFIENIRVILKPKKIVKTDWDGIYLYETENFGDVDIFPLKYMTSCCFKCKQPCSKCDKKGEVY